MLALVSGPAIAGGLLARVAPRAGWRLAVAGGLAIVCSALLLYVTALAHWSVAILALGIAFRVSQLEPGARWWTWQARLAGAAVVIVGLLFLGDTAGDRLHEQRALAALPQAAAGAPHVLLIVLDTVRADSLSAYGRARSTSPALERFARQGVQFDAAFSTAPWTLPSHASLLTGRWPHELSVHWQRGLDGAAPTAAERFAALGYATAAFSANWLYVTRESGLMRGFSHADDYTASAAHVMQASSLGRFVLDENSPLRHRIGNYQIAGRRSAAEINERYLRWLDTQGDRPTFAMLNYFDAHYPYVTPADAPRRFGTDHAGSYTLDTRNHSPEIDRAMVDDYENAIAYLDSQLAALFEALAGRHRFDNTLIVVTADHGEEFGEHGLYEHGHSLYRPSVQVPLMLRLPGAIPAGVHVEVPVSGRDVAATMLALAGSPGTLPGQSLEALWTTPRPSSLPDVVSEVQAGVGLPKWFPVSKGDMYADVVGHRRTIHNGDGSIEVYDIAADPGEHKSLVGAGTSPGVQP